MATNEEIQIAIAEGRAIFDDAGNVATIFLGLDDEGLACFQPVTWSLS